MIVADLSASEIAQRLSGPGLVLQTGPFSFRVRSSIVSVIDGLRQLYAQHPVLPDDSYADFPVSVGPGFGLRRWLRPQARFHFDGRAIFEPLPVDQAFPLLEWGMNWCISSHAHQYLIMHAGVVERHGGALILPAPSGSGKSTLCAALVHSGWRLLSDELALVSMADGRLYPLCRPVSLKNASIDIIQAFAPQARFNRITLGTVKGSVTHMAVPAADVQRVDRPAQARWLLFPRYVAGSATLLQPRKRADSLVDLIKNAFNFSIHGDAGFQLAGDLVADMDCREIAYSDLRGAVAAITAWADEGSP